jgi:hypothetical protein
VLRAHPEILVVLACKALGACAHSEVSSYDMLGFIGCDGRTGSGRDQALVIG